MAKTKNIVEKILRILLILFLISILSSNLSSFSSSLFTKNCSKESKQYVVKRVFDGDTILLDNNKKIRFLGIDAFELEQNQYGKMGKDFLAMLILNKSACIETDIQENDIYGRTLGYVFLNPKTSRPPTLIFINEELLKSGLAILYDFPPNIKYIDRLKKAQTYARQNMLGVWKEHNFILETPSQWRHKHPFKKHKKFKLFVSL